MTLLCCIVLVLTSGLAGYLLGVWRFYEKGFYGRLVVVEEEGEKPELFVELKDTPDQINHRSCVVLDVVHRPRN